MFFSVTLDILIAAYILSRQRRIRIVRRRLSMRMPIIFGVIGLIELVSYSNPNHPATGSDYAWVFGTLAVGAILLGAIRALTVKIWTSGSWVVRQGTWLTIGLWVLSLGLHFLSGIGAQRVGAGELEASSFLLYVAVTYATQNYLVHRRAVPMWDALGPDVGQPLHVTFGQGPGGSGAYFASFRNGGPFGGNGPGFGPGFGPGSGKGFGSGNDTGFGRGPQNDPNIIDAEVVEDEGPPELR